MDLRFEEIEAHADIPGVVDTQMHRSDSNESTFAAGHENEGVVQQVLDHSFVEMFILGQFASADPTNSGPTEYLQGSSR